MPLEVFCILLFLPWVLFLANYSFVNGVLSMYLELSLFLELSSFFFSILSMCLCRRTYISCLCVCSVCFHGYAYTGINYIVCVRAYVCVLACERAIKS